MVNDKHTLPVMDSCERILYVGPTGGNYCPGTALFRPMLANRVHVPLIVFCKQNIMIFSQAAYKILMVRDVIFHFSTTAFDKLYEDPFTPCNEVPERKLTACPNFS